LTTQDAITAFGSAARLARALGITRQSVSGWGPDVPRVRAFHIAAVAAKMGLTIGKQE